MIKISTMTTTFRDRREDGMFTSYPESIRRCRAAGFEVLDLNMCSMSKAETNELCGDDWERYVDDIIAERDRQGIQFYQSHLPFRNASIVKFDDPLAEAFFWDMEHRALEITAKVGAKWAVVHPVYIPGENDWQKQIEHNHRIYDGLVEHAAKLGVGIAFENMVEFDQSRHRFAAYSEEMIALCDDYHCETVGLCWDFGHANTAMPERHAEGLRSLGKRLKCVHINDNRGKSDDHVIPFSGNIPWEELMPILTEIGFEGTLNQELKNYNLPDDLKDDWARFTASILRKLQTLTLNVR